MGFRFRRSFKIAPGIRVNFNSKSTSVRIGPKGLGYTFSSNGKKRVSASIPGTGISYSEVVSTGRRQPAVPVQSLDTAPPTQKASLWPWIMVVVGVFIAFNVFGNNGSTTSNTASIHAPSAPVSVALPTAATPSSAKLPQASAPPMRQSSSEIRYVTASSLNVRSAPSTSGEIVGKAANGQEINILERADDWLLVLTGSGSRGWVSEQYTSTSRPAPVVAPRPQALVSTPAPSVNRDAIVQQIIERSIRNYSGNCPCPYNINRAGRRCGGNSAYSKPGGRSPICFASDVTEAMIANFRP